MIPVKCDYKIKDDIDFFLESTKISALELSEKTKISRTTLEEIAKAGRAASTVCEKFYAFAYEHGYRMNAVKEELAKEQFKNVLFHGSKEGLEEITANGSRTNCDFGKGFYTGETYSQALAFVCENSNSSVYSFSYSPELLKVKRFDCSLEWMLTICHYRGTLGKYDQNDIIKKIVAEVEAADMIVAPIADNKMFYVMAQFAEGEINADAALHSLSASSLGLQYVFRTDAAVNALSPIEKYYICNPERENCKRSLNERAYAIDTKLKLAKREFKTGLYIEEILK